LGHLVTNNPTASKPTAEDLAFGMSERWISHEDGSITVARQQLVGDHVDYCTARRNEGLHGPSKDFKLMASIPAVVVEHYCRIRGITLQEFTRNREHAKAIVNDPAFADLRIAPGRM
jgi:hypothetical protein